MVDKRNKSVIDDPLLNKGTYFTIEERERLGLRGLVPPIVCSIEKDIDRELARYNSLSDPLEKYRHLENLDGRNRTLYYKILVENLESIAVVYTPTVGLACLKYQNLFNRARGMYFSLNDRDTFVIWCIIGLMMM